MLNPISISEKLLFSTVKIYTSSGTGTGFFFSYLFGNKEAHVIITNKHVLNHNTEERASFLLHTDKDNLKENVNINFDAEWFFHESYDLAFTFAQPLINEIKTKLGKNVFYTVISEDLIPDDDKLKTFSAIEDIVMLGYPIGLSDTVNNLPIFRKGITASHIATDFDGEKIGVADIACFPGSSGSPIFILNESMYSDKYGNSYLGDGRIIFVGVNFAGHTYSSVGKIVVRNTPTKQEAVAESIQFVNTSMYVKSSELLSFKSKIQEFIK